MKKKLSLILCILSCILMMAGCSLTKTNENFDKKTLKTDAEAFITSWFDYDFAGAVKDYKDQMDEDTLNQYQQSVDLQKQYGKMNKAEKTEYTINSDSATVTQTVSTEKGPNKKLIFSVTYDEEGNMSSWKVEEYKTLGQKMANAGINTVMSMCIVFIVLIFIAIIIAQFERISNLQNKSKKKTEAVEEKAVEAQPAVAALVEENLTDDLELVAVITAAIAAASENECTDGLVIRSIIRR